MRTFWFLFLVGSATVPLLAQPHASSTTKGSCSPAVSGNGNTFKIECHGLSKEQSQELLAVLKKLTNNSLDRKVVMSMLDELIANTRSLKTDVSEIRREQVGRRPSDELSERLVRRLSVIRDREPITIELVNGTAESTAFAERLSEIFEKAGWKSTITPLMGFGQGVLKGQEISVRDSSNPVAGEIQHVFKENGITFRGLLKPTAPSPGVSISIYPIP